MNNYLSMYSQEMNGWVLFQAVNEFGVKHLWKCKSEVAASKLADAMNNGATICRGCKKLGNACGTCIKCQSIDY